MPTFREDPAAYMRDYRARKRAELAAACDKAASIKGVITSVNGRLDVMTKEAFEARQQQAAPAARPSSPAPSPSLLAAMQPAACPKPSAASLSPPSQQMTIYRPPLQGEAMPPPRSMVACGGTPPSRYPVKETIAAFQIYAAAQERANVEMAQRLVALEKAKAETDRRLAAIEQRGEGLVAVLKGLSLLFS
jgi:hypothetical protein